MGYRIAGLSCQIWCKSIQKWRSYSRLTDFKTAPAAILDFCTMWILAVNLTVGPHFQPTFQIRCKCVQKWPSYGQKCDFQYGGRLFAPPKIYVFGGFAPKHYFSSSRPPKGTCLAETTSYEPLSIAIGRVVSSGQRAKYTENKNTFCGKRYLSHCCSLHGTVLFSRL